jgi:hypothetical protein
VKGLTQFTLADGSTILVEVDDATPTEAVRGIRPSDAAEKAQVLFEEALEKIKPAAGAIVSKLRDLTEPPQQVGLEFGIKLSAAAGAFIASAGSEANFKVTLSWTRTKEDSK